MTKTEKMAIRNGLSALENSKLWTNLNNKEFKLVHYMINCLNLNTLPSEKDVKIFAKLIKRSLKA